MSESPRTAVHAAIKRATAAANKAVEQLDAEGIRELERIYRQAAADIAGRIAQHAGPDGNLALNEMRSALSQIEARLRELGQARDAQIDAGLVQAADLGVRPYTSAAIGTAAISTAASMRIANEALNFVRTFIAEDGLQLSDRIWRIDRGARDAVVNAIEQAVIQGHGASQAAAEFLARGIPVPDEVRDKIGAAAAARLAKITQTALVTGNGSPMDNAMRLFRTEINRAHGEAYMMGGEDHPDFGGWRYLLSPAHPKPDICDLLSTQNLYGLGGGVYPSRDKTPWPAHPNTLSFIAIVFKDEITQADRDGQETPMQALARLKPAQRLGVLGTHKNQAYKDGKLTQGMIRAPWKAVKLRTGDLKVVTPLTRDARPAISKAQVVPDALAGIRGRLANTVRLPGATVDQLRSIGQGMEKVLAPAGIRVGTLGWIEAGRQRVRANAYYEHYPLTHQPGANDSMRFSREYANGARERAERARASFAEQRRLEIARLETMIAEPGRSRPSVRGLETRLAQTRAAERWSASSEAANPLFVTAAHESGHALYYYNRAVETTWIEQLNLLAVSRLDMVKVSEYGASKVEELFAEVTALIADGRRSVVPEKILRAYDAAVAKVK